MSFYEYVVSLNCPPLLLLFYHLLCAMFVFSIYFVVFLIVLLIDFISEIRRIKLLNCKVKHKKGEQISFFTSDDNEQDHWKGEQK